MKGWVYVAINASMPGLVKVGRTERPPTDRMRELSAATGVPTPFVLVFDQYFSDCIAAEAFVHASFEKMGARKSPNREFFVAECSDVIKAVLQAPGLAPVGQGGGPAATHQNDPVAPSTVPWSAPLGEGIDAFYGRQGHFKDYQEARRKLKLAARLGSGEAFWLLGKIDVSEWRGESTKPLERAIANFREATRLGFYFALGDLTFPFWILNQNDNVILCLDHFLSADCAARLQEWHTVRSAESFIALLEHCRPDLMDDDLKRRSSEHICVWLTSEDLSEIIKAQLRNIESGLRK